jgi:hypothetical protein
MKTHHWFTLVIVAAIFYVIGARMPAIAQKVGVA